MAFCSIPISSVQACDQVRANFGLLLYTTEEAEEGADVGLHCITVFISAQDHGTLLYHVSASWERKRARGARLLVQGSARILCHETGRWSSAIRAWLLADPFFILGSFGLCLLRLHGCVCIL